VEKRFFGVTVARRVKHTPAVWDNLEMFFPFHSSSCLS
jgi:hypothetical protein